MFQIHKYLPYTTFGIVLLTAALFHYSGVVTISRRLILSLLSLLVVVTGLIVGFIMIIPYFNCVLMENHRVVEQPFKSENLTQKMTRGAVDFIERYRVFSLIHGDQKTDLLVVLFEDHSCICYVILYTEENIHAL